MLEHEVLPGGHVHELHLRRHRPGVVRRQTHAVGLRKRDTPAADAPRRLVDPGHKLAAARVLVFAARIVELAGNAREQAADGLAVLPGDRALSLPEVPVADALIIADVQEFVRRDVHEIGPDLARALCLVPIACSFRQITVERPQDGLEHDGAGRGPVGAGTYAVGSLERVREGLVGGKAVLHRDIEQSPVGVAHIAQGKRQPPQPQIVPERHTGQRPEPARRVVFGVAEPVCQRAQRQRLVLLRADAAVHDGEDVLNISVPLCHGLRLLTVRYADLTANARPLPDSCCAFLRCGRAPARSCHSSWPAASGSAHPELRCQARR